MGAITAVHSQERNGAETIGRKPGAIYFEVAFPIFFCMFNHGTHGIQSRPQDGGDLGQPLDMGAKSTLLYLLNIVRRMLSGIHVAFAGQVTDTLRWRYSSELKAYVGGINVEKFIGRAYVPAMYYPRRLIPEVWL
ncbi:hypothetical protein C8R48DRAFT_674357 [Suillus tomentosus]|nr:hypothetical protein C8R48DRAFT_674357 [Suillus tomentosus]